MERRGEQSREEKRREEESRAEESRGKQSSREESRAEGSTKESKAEGSTEETRETAQRREKVRTSLGEFNDLPGRMNAPQIAVHQPVKNAPPIFETCANNEQARGELWWQEPPMEGKSRCFCVATTGEQENFATGTE